MEGPGKGIQVFCSYSHKDEKLRDQLEVHLVSLRRQGLISLWHDRKIRAGEEWKGQIDSYLEAAQIILLLISADFLASDYCYDVEMKRALERHIRGDACVIPIILSPVAGWKEVSIGSFRLGNLQAVPRDGKPVKTWADRNEAFQNIAEELRAVIRELDMPMSPSHIQQRYVNRELVRYALRLVPKQDFREDGLLGKQERKYVFIGDYAEQRGRSLGQILSNLWMGDAFDQVSNATIEWVAIVFEVGEHNYRKFDLMPATWKAIFRILSDPKRLNRIEASDEERLHMGYHPRDYYSNDQNYWYNRLPAPGPPSEDDLISSLFGVDWRCFQGDGITYRDPERNSSTIPSRLFLVKNVPIAETNCRFQELGSANEEIVLRV
jgi:hypothetical protein